MCRSTRLDVAGPAPFGTRQSARRRTTPGSSAVTCAVARALPPRSRAPAQVGTPKGHFLPTVPKATRHVRSRSTISPYPLPGLPPFPDTAADPLRPVFLAPRVTETGAFVVDTTKSLSLSFSQFLPFLIKHT
jgi:hypothetical protein